MQRIAVFLLLFCPFGLVAQRSVAFDAIQKNLLADVYIGSFGANAEQLKLVNDLKSLRLLRNTIFARHGYRFKAQDLSDYFAGFSWYHPSLNNVDSLLTVRDRDNLAILQEKELSVGIADLVGNNGKGRTLSSEEKTLVGIWQDLAMVASGWNNTYQFFPNGKVIKRCSQMNCEERDRSWIGNWEVNKGNLKLEFFHKEYIEGGHLEPASGSCGTEKELIDGETKLLQLKKTQSFTYSISTVSIDTENNGMPKIRIENTDFWKFAPDPTAY